MSNDKGNSRPIDDIRNSAMSMKVGAPDDGKITEMVSVSDRMLVVMERAIHVMQLADSVDPARTNIAIPNTQQRLLKKQREQWVYGVIGVQSAWYPTSQTLAVCPFSSFGFALEEVVAEVCAIQSQSGETPDMA